MMREHALSTIILLFACMFPHLNNAQPGDRTPLQQIHPSLDLINIRPNSFQPRVGGMDWMSDGKLVIATWEGLHSGVEQAQYGKVYLVSGTQQNDPNQVQVQEFASRVEEPLGAAVVNDTVYIASGRSITQLIDTDGDGQSDIQNEFVKFNDTHARHEFTFGLIHRDRWLYTALSLGISGIAIDPQPNPNRGRFVRVNLDTKEIDYIAGGFRQPNGIGVSPIGEFFVSDNQGDWLPSCKVVHVEKGGFYGHHKNPSDALFDPNGNTTSKDPVTWHFQNEIGNSTSQPSYVPTGPFKGQWFVGDITYGGIQRIFMEKINGNWQGSLFRFSNSITPNGSRNFEGAPNRILWGPSGEFLVGFLAGDAGGGSWNWRGRTQFGLQKFRFNNTRPFEMFAVRSRPGGMEIELTQPVGNAANNTSMYSIFSYQEIPQAEYGELHKQNEQNLNVTSIQISPDRRKVFLQINNLTVKRVIYIRLNRSLTSQTNETLWATEAWYTLNSIGTGNPFDVNGCTNSSYTEYDPYAVVDDGSCQTMATAIHSKVDSPILNFKIEKGYLISNNIPDKKYTVQLFDQSGKRILMRKGFGSFKLNVSHFQKNKLYFLHYSNDKNFKSQKILIL